MKALTLTQFWASAVALGLKRIETRSWRTSYRGPLAIHAAAGLGPVGGMKGLHKQIATEPFWSAFREAFAADLGGERYYPADATTVVDQLPLGAIVATCRLIDCVPTRTLFPGWKRWQYPGTEHSIRWEMTEQERAFGDYSDGRYAWLLADIQALSDPIPCKGSLGLWKPDETIYTAIEGQQTVIVSR